MIGFISTSSQLQSIITAHILNSFWTTSAWRISLTDLWVWSESESYVTTDGQSGSLSWNKAPIWGLRPDFYCCQTVAALLMWALPLTRGRVCRLQLLLILASAVILGSESRGTRDHILLPQIRDFPFRRLLGLARLRWRYSTPAFSWTELTSRRTEYRSPSQTVRSFCYYLFYPLLRNVAACC
jgi:hypothetical protein